MLRHRPVRRALALTFVADIAQGIFLVLFLVFVARRLHGGPGEIGLLRGIQAVGAILAGLSLAALARGRSPARLTAGGALVFGLVSLLVWNLPALTTEPAVYAVLFALVGAPGVVMGTGLISFLQQAGAAGASMAASSGRWGSPRTSGRRSGCSPPARSPGCSGWTRSSTRRGRSI